MARQVKRISDLPEAGPIQGDELLEIVQGGENVRVRADELGGGSGVPDESVTRAKLADQFSFNSVMTSGDLNAQRLPEGSYLVSTGVANRPIGMPGGNAALKVAPVGNWDIQEISSIANPEKIFRSVFRFDSGAFGEWVPFGGGSGGAIPDGA